MTRGQGGRARRARERGSVSIEMVILFPLALTLLFVTVQGAIYYHARGVAMASAQEGARDAAAKGSSDSLGQEAAMSFAGRAGGDGILGSPEVSVERTDDAVTVTVTGTTLSVIPGWDPKVTQSSTRPLEDFSAPRNPVNPDGVGEGGPEDPAEPLPIGGAGP
ncbi:MULTISPECIES: TadE family protein [Janibacter]|uniref:TadE/TadG family type IV pilus assembly protein n=1 Tax=Janibacter TaxID=53457 RepID=UPI001E62D287|nr:TadE family protein [Janibacter melonis]MCB5992164.1 pilus assembly protein [Janibacter melonis]MCM3556271.1 pilus assembly protein [Janibacter melonis]